MPPCRSSRGLLTTKHLRQHPPRPASRKAVRAVLREPRAATPKRSWRKVRRLSYPMCSARGGTSSKGPDIVWTVLVRKKCSAPSVADECRPATEVRATENRAQPSEAAHDDELFLRERTGPHSDARPAPPEGGRARARQHPWVQQAGGGKSARRPTLHLADIATPTYYVGFCRPRRVLGRG